MTNTSVVLALTQVERADAGRDVQAHVAFDAERLKRDRLVESAQKDVGANADADRGACRCTGVAAFERTRVKVGRGRDDRPNHPAAAREADIDADLRDGA